MPTNRLKKVLHHLHQTLQADVGELSDGHLLACFVATRDERAFATLVRRHGSMVMGVCHRILRHQQDAEDAFQATFLILARKAASVVKREAVGSYLYITAYRTALAARARSARLRSREQQVEHMPHPEVPPAEIQDWKPYLDQELSRLSTHYRAVLVLCDLEGCSRREAARQLGVPEGTVSSWLHRARVLLARRLGRYRLVLPGGALASALAGGSATAAVPSGLVTTVVHGAALVAAGQAAGIAAPTALLMKEVLQTMLITKLKGYVAAALVAVLLGVGVLSYRALGQGQATPKPTAAQPLSDLEELRSEVEILKAQVDFLLKKVKAQGAEIRVLKERQTAAPAGKTTKPASGTSARPDRPTGVERRDAPANPFDDPIQREPGSKGVISLPPPATAPAPANTPVPLPATPTAPLGVPSVPPANPTAPSNVPSALPPTPAATPPALEAPAAPQDRGGHLLPPSPAPTRAPAAAPDTPGAVGPAPDLTPRTESVSPEQEAEAALKALRAAPPNSPARCEALKVLERALKRLKQDPSPPAAS